MSQKYTPEELQALKQAESAIATHVETVTQGIQRLVLVIRAVKEKYPGPGTNIAEAISSAIATMNEEIAKIAKVEPTAIPAMLQEALTV